MHRAGRQWRKESQTGELGLAERGSGPPGCPRGSGAEGGSVPGPGDGGGGGWQPRGLFQRRIGLGRHAFLVPHLGLRQEGERKLVKMPSGPPENLRPFTNRRLGHRWTGLVLTACARRGLVPATVYDGWWGAGEAGLPCGPGRQGFQGQREDPPRPRSGSPPGTRCRLGSSRAPGLRAPRTGRGAGAGGAQPQGAP